MAAGRQQLQGAVFVRDGATLTIEPGTTIMGDTEGKGTLIVAQDAMIMAEGTAMQPIIMTSPQELGGRGPQDWGGLILNGRATLNVDGGISEGEGDTGTFGGGENPDDTDNSGNLQYVRVEFAGIEFSPENELNGIAFQGVGSKPGSLDESQQKLVQHQKGALAEDASASGGRKRIATSSFSNG